MESLSTRLSSTLHPRSDPVGWISGKENIRHLRLEGVILNHLCVCIIQGNIPPGVPVVGCPKEGKEKRQASNWAVCQSVFMNLLGSGCTSPSVTERQS